MAHITAKIYGSIKLNAMTVRGHRLDLISRKEKRKKEKSVQKECSCQKGVESCPICVDVTFVPGAVRFSSALCLF